MTWHIAIENVSLSTRSKLIKCRDLMGGVWLPRMDANIVSFVVLIMLIITFKVLSSKDVSLHLGVEEAIVGKRGFCLGKERVDLVVGVRGLGL